MQDADMEEQQAMPSLNDMSTVLTAAGNAPTAGKEKGKGKESVKFGELPLVGGMKKDDDQEWKDFFLKQSSLLAPSLSHASPGRVARLSARSGLCGRGNGRTSKQGTIICIESLLLLHLLLCFTLVVEEGDDDHPSCFVALYPLLLLLFSTIPIAFLD